MRNIFKMIEIGMIEDAIFLPVFSPLAIIDDIARGNSNLISNKPQMGNRKLFYDMLSDNPKNAFELLCSIKESSLLQRLKNKVTAVFNKKR